MAPASKRALAVAAIAALSLMALGALPVANAASAGPYSGHAHGSVVHVDALTNASTRVADAEVGVSNAAVDSEGLEKTLNAYDRPITPAGLGGKHSRGHSSILEAGVVHAPDADNQIKPFEQADVAPPTGVTDESVLKQTIGPVLHVDVLRNITAAKWNADTCIIGEPISVGEQHVVRAQVLEQAADEDTEDFDGALVGVNADKISGKRALTTIRSIEQLYSAGGGTFGLQSVSVATLAPITLLEGTANEFTIEVDGPSYLNAIANGKAGGAKAQVSVPTVSIIQGGELTEVITGTIPGDPIEILVPPGPTGDKIAEVRVGVVKEKTEAANGTKASAVANVVEIELLDLASQNLKGATIALGHLEAASQVPAGGIDCPIPVTKVANPRSVTSGDEFTVTMTVTNPFNCPLTNVTLEDKVTVEDDARFEVLDTTPTAASAPGGSNLSSGTLKWNLGTIEPGKSKTVKATFLAQGGAGKIIDVATASGALGNCAAGPSDAETDVTALTKVKVPVDGRTRLVVPESRVLGGRELPATGIPTAALGGLGLLAASGVTALAARKRKPVKH